MAALAAMASLRQLPGLLSHTAAEAGRRIHRRLWCFGRLRRRWKLVGPAMLPAQPERQYEGRRRRLWWRKLCEPAGRALVGRISLLFAISSSNQKPAFIDLSSKSMACDRWSPCRSRNAAFDSSGSPQRAASTTQPALCGLFYANKEPSNERICPDGRLRLNHRSACPRLSQGLS